MGFLFSKPKKQQQQQQGTSGSGSGQSSLSKVEEGQLALRRARDRVMKQSALAEKDAAKFLGRASEALRAGRREDAKRFLTLKKMREKALEVARGQLTNLETLVNSIDTEVANQEFLAAMAQGNKALKQLQELMPLERAEAIMEESAEAQAAAQELDDMITSYGGVDAVSQAEIDAALEGIAAEAAAATAAAAGAGAGKAAAPAAVAPAAVPAAAAEEAAPLVFPAVPTHTPQLPAAAAAAPAPARAAEPELVPA